MTELNNPLSRRQVLKLLGAGAGMLYLAGCGSAPATEAPANAPAESSAAEATATPVAKVEAPPTPTPGAVMATGPVAESYEAGQAAYGWYDEWHPSTDVDLLVWGPLAMKLIPGFAR